MLTPLAVVFRAIARGVRFGGAGQQQPLNSDRLVVLGSSSNSDSMVVLDSSSLSSIGSLVVLDSSSISSSDSLVVQDSSRAQQQRQFGGAGHQQA